MNYIQESSESKLVQIETSDNLQDRVKIDVKDDTLYISLSLGSYQNANVTVIATSSQLTSIDANDASTINIALNDNEDSVGNSSLDISASKASVINFSSGRVARVNLDLSDASKYNGLSLVADSYVLSLSDASSAELSAKNSISGTTSDASILNYSGSPSLSVDSSDASIIKRAN